MDDRMIMFRVDDLRLAFNSRGADVTNEEALQRFMRENGDIRIILFSDFRPGLQDFLNGTPYALGDVDLPDLPTQDELETMDTDAGGAFAAQLAAQSGEGVNAGGGADAEAKRTPPKTALPKLSSGFVPGKTYSGTRACVPR